MTVIGSPPGSAYSNPTVRQFDNCQLLLLRIKSTAIAQLTLLYGVRQATAQAELPGNVTPHFILLSYRNSDPQLNSYLKGKSILAYGTLWLLRKAIGDRRPLAVEGVVGAIASCGHFRKVNQNNSKHSIPQPTNNQPDPIPARPTQRHPQDGRF